MKVTLAQYGGLAAGIRREPRVLDAHALSAEAAEELAKLVSAAKAAARPDEERGPGRARDAMSYTVTVEEDGQQSVLRGSDTDMSAAFAALLDWLERHSETK